MIKNILKRLKRLKFTPNKLSVAYIEMLNNDYGLLNTQRAYKIKSEIFDLVGSRDQRWVAEQEILLQTDELMVRMATIKLIGNTPKDNVKNSTTANKLDSGMFFNMNQQQQALNMRPGMMQPVTNPLELWFTTK
jgi:hypothetical protein